MFTREEIQRHLKELLVLKRNGNLDTEEKFLNLNDDDLWRNCITYDRLYSYAQYADEDIKLNTLALIVESKKSTLRFTAKELDLILLFLQVNFKEKLEFVPLIKKALKRMKDSLIVMERQCVREEKMRMQYRKSCDPLEFKQEALDRSRRESCKLQKDIDMYHNTFQSLHNMCICDPGATYRRRQSSLRILLIMKELLNSEFECITWTAKEARTLFDLLLLDTYESNKKMAFDLIKSMDPVLLELNSESNVYNIIKVAIDLGNSIRPIDSVTAAYMFKVSLLSPVIENVFETRFDLVKRSEDVAEVEILGLVLILFKKLRESLVFARENIVTTVTKYSLYGYLFCIRSLLEDCNLGEAGKDVFWQNAISELVQVCFEFSRAVSLIVNNSSPEGHLPMDLNLQIIRGICALSSEKQTVTPQMILLCSWRTVKEISLLFGFLASKAPIHEENSCSGLLNESQIIRIGEHLVSLLSETKHRGAFEQAHVGFSQLCSRFWRSKRKSLNELPKSWLHQILMAITGLKEENSKLCATRRSAGVPFMIQALLSTEPRKYRDRKTKTFDSVMKILLGLTEVEGRNLRENIKQLMYENTAFSEYENTVELLERNDDRCIDEGAIQVTEIKIHALNILRALFRNSQIAEVVSDYVEDGLIAGFKSYNASTWAERNAATLLFSALVIRIFGVQRTKDHINLTSDNKMNYRVFFEKYPRLLPFILNELDIFVRINDTVIKSGVQSILLLLSRLYHSHNSASTDIEWKINDLIALSMQCAKSTIYETRKLAARALVALLTEESAKEILTELVENIISAEEYRPSLNLIHGYMLQILEILKQFESKKYQSFGVDWDRFLKRTVWILKDLERESSNPPCFLLATVYINICCTVNDTNEICLMRHGSLLHILISHVVEEEKLKEGPMREDYRISVIEFIESIRKETRLISQCVPVTIYFRSLMNSEMQAVTWSAITNIINETSSSLSVLLLNYSINAIYNSIQDIHKYSPELQDAMFHFLYNSLTNFPQFDSGCLRKVDICKFILKDLRLNDNKSIYRERDSYLRLLGKSYVTLISSTGDAEEMNEECIDDVYNSFCDNSWIVSLSRNYRTSVFHIMQDLLSTCCKHNKYRFIQVEWWTTVLQLLLDNHPDIRYEAFALIGGHVPVDCPSNKAVSYLDFFLLKFYEYMYNRDPEFLCVVLFYWSVSLQEETIYEMDETDVFNKSTNYDFFEPVEVSKSCATFLAKRMKRFMDNVLSDDIINWINARLNTQFAKRMSFRLLVKNYESHVPTFDDRLQNILDPTYKNKLLQVLAYRELTNIL